MTFDLSDEQRALCDEARALARERLAPRAAAIDDRGEVPADLVRAAAALLARAGDAVASALVIEELAAASGSVAAAVAIGEGRDELPGLKGARSVPAGELNRRLRVLIGALALGIGRAAIEAALGVCRHAGERPGGAADERPHWVLADATTEIDAARLLVWKGAQALAAAVSAEADLALAQTMATGAAERCVAAAIRITGAEGYRRGTLLERLSRDARTLAFIAGTEEDHRLVAAQTLPQ